MTANRKPLALAGVMGVAVIVVSVTAALAGWFPETRLTNASGASLLSGNNARCLVTDSSGDVHLVWYDERDGEAEIYHSSFNGTSWTPESTLTSSGYSSEYPSLAADATGAIHLVWSRYVGSSGMIYYKQFDGSTWLPSESITDPAAASDRPSVAADDTGRVHVVWREYRDGNWGIYYKAYDGTVWSEEELLTDPAGYPRYASIAAGESGRVHVAWDDYGDGNWEIYYRAFDGTSWGAEERLTADAGASESPSLLIDSYGDIHVFWDDDREGSPAIYHKVNDGLGWSSDERIVEPVTGAHAPYAAAGDSGRIHLVWFDDDAGDREIYYKEFDGVLWSASERLSNNYNISRNPAVAVGGDGVPHVVWHDDRKGNFEIYWRAKRDIPAPEIISIEPDSEYAYQDVHISDLAGTGFFAGAEVWLRKDGEPDIVGSNVVVESSTRITCDFKLDVPGDWDVVVENLDGGSDALLSGFHVIPLPKPEIASIEPDSQYAYQNVHITDLAGTAFYEGAEVWLQKAGEDDIVATNVVVESLTRITCDFSLAVYGYWDVVVMNIDGKSDTLSSGFYVVPLPDLEIISIEPAMGMAYESVHITDLLGSGFYSGAAVWLQKAGEDSLPAENIVVDSGTRITCDLSLAGADSGYWDVVVWNPDEKMDTLETAFLVLPSLWEEDVRLTYDLGISSTSRPNGRCIALDSAGNPHIVWYDDRPGNTEIYYKKFDGSSWGPDTRLTADPGASEFPAIAIDSFDRIHVVWGDSRDGGREVYYKMYNGSSWSSDQRLTDATGDSQHPSIAVDSHDNLHVVWQDDRSGSPVIYYRSYDGSTWLPEESIASGYTGSGMPAVAVDGFNHVHVLWYSDVGGTDHLYYKSYDGTVWSEVVTLASRALIYGPTIAVDINNRVHVAWHDRRYGSAWGYEVFYRRFNGLGWDPEEQVTNARLGSHNASVATDDSGTVYLVWADKRTGDNEIYYAKNDGTGWGANVRLTRSVGESRRPSLAVTPEGELHLIWQDSRAGNAEIYYKTRGLGEFAGLENVVPGDICVRILKIAPNPVRSGTAIRFHLAASGKSDLAVYDIRGRLVSKIGLGELQPGTQLVTWDGTSQAGEPVAPGVYFAVVKAGSGVASAKLVVVK